VVWLRVHRTSLSSRLGSDQGQQNPAARRAVLPATSLSLMATSNSTGELMIWKSNDPFLFHRTLAVRSMPSVFREAAEERSHGHHSTLTDPSVRPCVARGDRALMAQRHSSAACWIQLTKPVEPAQRNCASSL
jgi:hypothetical protein